MPDIDWRKIDRETEQAEAGGYFEPGPDHPKPGDRVMVELTEAAKQIKLAYDSGVQAERERCAKVAERYMEQNRQGAAEQSRIANRCLFPEGSAAARAAADELTSCANEAEAIAAAIRKRPSCGDPDNGTD